MQCAAVAAQKRSPIITMNKCLTGDEFRLKAKVPIEYLFNFHIWCDPEWCWAKELDDTIHKLMTDR